MQKKAIYILLLLLLLSNIIFFVKNTNSRKELNTLLESKETGVNENSLINKIFGGIDNSVNLINKNISTFNINKEDILLNQHNLLFYFNDKTCGTCIDEAIVDLGDMVDGNLDKIVLLVLYSNERDYIFLNEKIDHKYPILKVTEKDIPFLSPTFLIVNKEGLIINAHTYVKEFPDCNKLFLMSANNILSN